MAIKGALSSRKNTATTARFSTRNSAEWMALRLKSIPSAAPTATRASRKKTTRSTSSAVMSVRVLHVGDGPVELARLHLLRRGLAARRHRHDEHLLGVQRRVALGEGQLV